jgi:hypothetical protein
MSAQEGIGAAVGGLSGLAVRLWTELKTNSRASAGLLIIIGVLGLYGLLTLADVIEANRSAYRQQVVQTQRALSISQDKDWPARAQQSADVRAALEKRLWQFESEGVALANIQDFLTAAGRDSGLTKFQVRIDVGRVKDLGAETRQFSATISATQTEEALQKFLEKIQRAPSLLVVESMHVQQRPPTLQMTLQTYARISDPSGGAAK